MAGVPTSSLWRSAILWLRDRAARYCCVPSYWLDISPWSGLASLVLLLIGIFFAGGSDGAGARRISVVCPDDSPGSILRDCKRCTVFAAAPVNSNSSCPPTTAFFNAYAPPPYMNFTPAGEEYRLLLDSRPSNPTIIGPRVMVVLWPTVMSCRGMTFGAATPRGGTMGRNDADTAFKSSNWAACTVENKRWFAANTDKAPSKKEPKATKAYFTVSPPENCFQRYPSVRSIYQVVVRASLVFSEGFGVTAWQNCTQCECWNTSK